MSRRSSGIRIYQIGDPLLSKITLKASPPPPRLSMKMGSGSGWLVGVRLMRGKSLGTETPLGLIFTTPFTPVVKSCGETWGAFVIDAMVGTAATADAGDPSGRCPKITNLY